MKKTKIICTIGPASGNKDVLIKMIQNGMDVARLNFSHGTHEEHLERINLIKEVRKKFGKPIAIMLDTKGPEIRIGKFKGGSVLLKTGAEFSLTSKNIIGDENIVSVSYKNLIKELEVGDDVLIADGMVVLKVVKVFDDKVLCDVVVGGELTDNKGMNFPKRVMRQKFLSNVDKSDILFGIENDVDYIACSFVSVAQNVKDVRNLLNKNGGQDIGIIAKIENQSGVDNIDEILSICDGIMIGRGDMGVEIDFEKLPKIQKYLIKKCLSAGKIVITATEMLESMIKNPRPTRAEVSDVANAVYDGSSAIMLSGETAVGAYPDLAVKYMAKIAEQTEESINYEGRFAQSPIKMNTNLDAISHSTVMLAIDTNAKAIVASSKTGRTVKAVAKFHSPVDVLGAVTNKKEYNKLALYWGVRPYMAKDYKNLDKLFVGLSNVAREVYNLSEGDNVVITGGTGNLTNTNLVKIEKISLVK